jgi:cell wall-associated NlpC family hydrolase
VGSLAQAMPGDLLIFDWGDGGITDHVALYAGNNKMISGNDHNDSVGESAVPAGALVGIVRPKYPGTRPRKRLLPRIRKA